MRKGLLLGALEDLDDILPPTPDEGDDTEFDAAMLAVMEDDKELDARVDELDGLNAIEENIETSVERLEGIRDAIVKHGICKSMMEASDPHAELVEKGICGAYENLNDSPVKDADAQAAVEGIGDAIKTIFTKFIPFYINSVGTLMDYADSIAAAYRSNTTALTSGTKRLTAAGKLDETKFKGTSVKACTKQNFEGAIRSVTKIVKFINSGLNSKFISEIEALSLKPTLTNDDVFTIVKKVKASIRGIADDKDVVEYCGLDFIKFDDPNDEHVVVALRGVKWGARGTAGELGWKANDVAKALKDAMSVNHSLDILSLKTAALAKLCKSYSAALKTNSKRAGEFKGETVAAFKAANAIIRELISTDKSLIRGCQITIKLITSSVLNLTKAALKSKSSDTGAAESITGQLEDGVEPDGDETVVTVVPVDGEDVTITKDGDDVDIEVEAEMKKKEEDLKKKEEDLKQEKDEFLKKKAEMKKKPAEGC